MPLSRIAIFLSVVLTIDASLHYYFWARLVRDTALPAPFRVAATALLALLALLVLAGPILSRAAPRAIAAPVLWIAYTWMGAAFFLLVLLLPADLGRAAVSLAGGNGDPARQQLTARGAGALVGLGALVAPLAGLRARDGVFFVTGNHEYYSGASEWVAYLRTLGVTVLRNERVTLGGERGFDLAGIDDSSARHFRDGHGADLPRALAGRDPARALVLLAHQPKAFEEAAAAGVGLQISGHTHGGQLFPFNYLVKIDQPYVAGLHARGASQVYVSRGTGYWGPPMRLGAPAEITRIELVSEG